MIKLNSRRKVFSAIANIINLKIATNNDIVILKKNDDDDGDDIQLIYCNNLKLT